MRQDTIEGIIGTFATKGGKGGDMAADGMSKALAGAEFVSFVNWNSGRQMWRPFDLVYKEITSQRCINVNCRSKWLVHEYSAAQDRMVSTCKICGTAMVS
jgi:hypothetical protein